MEIPKSKVAVVVPEKDWSFSFTSFVVRKLKGLPFIRDQYFHRAIMVALRIIVSKYGANYGELLWNMSGFVGLLLSSVRNNSTWHDRILE